MQLHEIQICITNKCSINCSYCHIDRSSPEIINSETFRRIVDHAKKQGIPAIRLTGGDIFQHPKLKEFLMYLKKNHMRSIINTHIKRIKDIHKILNLCDIILVSFHNIDEIENNIENLKNISLKTDLMGTAVFTKAWIPSLKKLSDLKNTIGFSPFFFLRNINESSKEYFSDLNELAERLTRFNKKEKNPILISNAFPLCFVSSEGIRYCSGKQFDNGFSRLYAAPNGNIKPSAYSSIELANINDPGFSFKEIYNKNKISVDNIINNNKNCQNCKINDYCGSGICANDNYSSDPLLQHVFHNKFTTKLQEIEKQELPNSNFQKDLRLIYHQNSSFYMRYPPSKYLKQIDEVSLRKKLKLKAGKINIYIHFPFCKGYCKFCTVKKINNHEMEKYKQHILEEIYKYKDIISNNYVETVYFGGGTPQLMGYENVRIIFKKLFSLIKNKPLEVNFELFPKDYDEKLMKLLKKYVTRISIGVQCLDDCAFQKLNRNSTKKEIIEFIQKIKHHNFDKINFDFIFGIYINNPENFESDFKEILSYYPDHITYQPLHFTKDMGFDKDNNLTNAFNLNQLGRNILEKQGYQQNSAEDFSKGDKVKYQDALLLQKNLIGLGNGSYGFMNDIAYQNEKGDFFFHKLTSTDKLFGELFLSARFLKIDIRLLDKRYNINFKAIFSDSLKYLIRMKYIEIKKNILYITKQGRNYVDLITNTLALNNLDYKLINPAIKTT